MYSYRITSEKDCRIIIDKSRKFDEDSECLAFDTMLQLLTKYALQMNTYEIRIILYGLCKKEHDARISSPGSFRKTLLEIDELIRNDFEVQIYHSHPDGEYDIIPLKEIQDLVKKEKEKKNVFLIQPSYQPHWSKGEPLGLLYLGSILEGAGYNVTIFDYNVINAGFERLLSEIDAESPIMIGISCHIMNALEGYRIGNLVKERFPDLPLVYGGAHPTILPEEPFERGSADMVSLFESEMTITEILERIKSLKGFQGIPGLFYKSEGNIVKDSTCTLVENLDNLPFPAYYLIDLNLYNPEFHTNEFPIDKVIHMVTTRGCPFRCDFCSSPFLSGNKVRFRSEENVIQEIKELVDLHDLHYLHFNDDNLMIDPRRIASICKKLPKGLRWVGTTRADVIVKNPNMLDGLKKSGCFGLEIGVECGDEDVLREMHKDITIKNIKEASRLVKCSGIFPMHLMISYIPGENIDSPYLSAKLLYELWFDKDIDKIPLDPPESLTNRLSRFNQSIAGHIMRISPGMKFYNRLDKIGICWAKDWDEHHEQIVRFIPYSMFHDIPVMNYPDKPYWVKTSIRSYSINIQRYMRRYFYSSFATLEEARIDVKEFLDIMFDIYSEVDGIRTVEEIYGIFCRRINLSVFISAISYLSIFRFIQGKTSSSS